MPAIQHNERTIKLFHFQNFAFINNCSALSYYTLHPHPKHTFLLSLTYFKYIDQRKRGNIILNGNEDHFISEIDFIVFFFSLLLIICINILCIAIYRLKVKFYNILFTKLEMGTLLVSLIKIKIIK